MSGTARLLPARRALLSAELTQQRSSGILSETSSPGHPENDMPIDINNDGTLQVPIYGEFKKKGN